ncbi:MAG TPA: YraN family protein [Acidimicrobiia bacterium]|nr:YraN family protein [Acidimicrobiia bacterium]
MTAARRLVGDAGEAAVAQWYRARGYEIVARNWRVREGEIDLVVRRGATIVFCEVKTRRSTTFGTPADAVTPRKQVRLRVLARAFLAAEHVRGQMVRFDVADVRPHPRNGWTIDVIEAAF